MRRIAWLLSLLLLVGCAAKTVPAVQPAPVAPPVTLTAPTTCGGHTVTVEAVAAPDPRLQVVGEGNVYREFKGAAYQGAWFGRAGGDAPLLVVGRQDGGRMFLQAYRCANDPVLLRPVLWDGLLEAQGNLQAASDQEFQVIAAADRVPYSYRWQDGQLRAAIPAALRARLNREQQVELAPGLTVTARTLDDGRVHPEGGPLLVSGDGGRTLLERVEGVLHVEGVRKAGETPLLLISVRGGGSMGTFYEAYRHHSGQGRLVPVPWGDQGYIISRDPVAEVPGGLQSTYRSQSPAGWRIATVRWEYRDGALRSTATTVAPPVYPDDLLSVLLLAFDTVARRLPDETPRYFRDPDLARHFYGQWVDQIPDTSSPSCTECSYRRPPDGPFYIWVPDGQWQLPGSSPSPEKPRIRKPDSTLFVFGSVRLLAATAAFTAGPQPQLTSLEVVPVTPAVETAAAARERLLAQPELQGKDVPAPVFQLGRWSVQTGGAIWWVDARTGAVTHQ